MTLIYLTLAWVCGMLMAYHAEPQPAFPLLLIALLVPGLVVFRRERSVLLWSGLFLALGMLRFGAAQPTTDDQHVVHLNDQGILTLRGVIIEEPEVRDQNIRILVRAEEAAGHRVNGRVLATVPRTSDLHYGDEVQLFGRLVTPPEFDTFSYRDYLERQNVFSLMPGADVVVLAEDQGIPFYAALFKIKDRARSLIQDSLPEPQASLLIGILLGDESGLPAETREAFTVTGASHIIAISGFNMVVLANIIQFSLSYLFPHRKNLVLGLSLLTILFYTLFVGAGAAVVRAAIMSSVLMIAKTLRRKTFVPTSLAFVVLVMSLINPWVLWDIGFQLSLAAVIGMALLVNPMERWTRRQVEKIASQKLARFLMGFLSESIIVTLAAQVTTTPLILYYFGRISLVSPLVNFLIIPAQTPLLFFGALGVLIGLFIPVLGELILNVAGIFLSWTVGVVEFFAARAWADTGLSLPQEVVLCLFVVLLLATLYRATRPRWAMRWVNHATGQVSVYGLTGASLLAIVLMGNAILDRPDGKLHVTFLEVGHENAVLIESPQGGTILIDGGSSPARLLNALGDALPPRTHHLDVVIITFPTAEYLATLSELTERYEIGAVITVDQAATDPDFAALMAFTSEEAIPFVPVSAGYRLSTEDSVRLEVLYPLEPISGLAEVWEGSLVLRLTYQDAAFLLTGNIQAQAEEILLQNPHLIQANVLQVADHGSNKASSAAIIEVVHPQAAVIQLDAGNQVGDPDAVVIERLAQTQLFRADQHGTIEISTDGSKLWILTETHE